MSQDDKQREEHLHADQDDAGGTHEEPFGEQSGDSSAEPEGAGGSEHGISSSEPFGNDEVEPERGVDPAGSSGEQDDD